MGRIQKLDEKVIALIAAGEVVERPSSVVKELVENSLDAGARSIEVAIDDGGKQKIQIIDDGCGMSRDEALLALQRHATSKIRLAEDLDSIATLGFRGEALPSIAAVSKLRIDTRPRDQDSGTRLIIEAGEVRSVEEVGAPLGTTLRVEDLFFSTPARRKFLKATGTETGRIHAAIIDLALAAPEVRFRLESKGRRLVDVPAATSEEGRRQRLGALLGRELYAAMYPFEGGEQGIQVHGYFAAPTHGRRDTRGYHLFLNGRSISDRQLMFAVRRAYRTLLEDGRHPVVVANLVVPPADVDVNVHPTKQEVRFRDARLVQDALAHSIAAAASKTPWIGSGRTYVMPGQVDAELRDREAEVQDWHRQRVRQALDRFAANPSAAGAVEPRTGGGSQGWSPSAVTPAGLRPAAPVASHEPAAGEPVPDLLAGGYFSRLQLVGQVFDTYLVCQADRRLVMVDQHAAHERLTFERLRGRRREGKPASQGLLVPVQLELDPLLLAAAEDHVDEIASLGFALEPFGGTTLSVRAVPVDLARGSVEPMVRDLLGDLAEHGSQQASEEAIDAVCARLACHGSIRAGRALRSEEVDALFRDLDTIDFGAHCPHGRPVARELSIGEIERLFERG